MKIKIERKFRMEFVNIILHPIQKRSNIPKGQGTSEMFVFLGYIFWNIILSGSWHFQSYYQVLYAYLLPSKLTAPDVLDALDNSLGFAHS